MINFFRKIRKQLLLQNKFSRYLLYAIGEILLVVLGILIALQVDNWNEKRKDHLKLTKILHDIVEDIDIDIFQLNRACEELLVTNEFAKSFLNLHDYTNFTRDSLEKSIERGFIGSRYHTNSYTNIKNSGITEYGIYRDIMKEIDWFYSTGIPRIKSIEKDMDDDLRILLKFWQEQNSYEFRYTQDLDCYQSDLAARNEFMALLKSPKSRNLLKIDFKNNEKLIFEYKRLIGILNALLEEIEKVGISVVRIDLT
ncbi:DUF6090 family protein [Muriicola sp. E247]|uniref:DUF6090 family protein n=1 Tax=Muriicola sp. E247 TaxID=3242730 RepID=UPI003525D994